MGEEPTPPRLHPNWKLTLKHCSAKLEQGLGGGERFLRVVAVMLGPMKLVFEVASADFGYVLHKCTKLVRLGIVAIMRLANQLASSRMTIAGQAL